MILFTLSSICKQIIKASLDSRNGLCGVFLKDVGFLYQVMKLKLTIVIIAYLCEYSINYSLVFFKLVNCWYVSYISRKLFLKKLRWLSVYQIIIHSI